MPSEKVLQQKQQLVEELSEKLKNAVAGVIVDYKGISVADDTKLRKELREAGVEYFVVKNTMLRFAADKAGLEGIKDVLEGTTAIGLSEDPVAAAKILSKFADDSDSDFAVKSGFVDGKVLSPAEISELAKLPSKEVLVAKVLGGLNAPISGFANVLSANIRGLVIALHQIAQKSA